MKMRKYLIIEESVKPVNDSWHDTNSTMIEQLFYDSKNIIMMLL